MYCLLCIFLLLSQTDWGWGVVVNVMRVAAAIKPEEEDRLENYKADVLLVCTASNGTMQPAKPGVQ
jgi:hypothetical protein